MEKININGKEFTAEELNKLIEEAKKPKFKRNAVTQSIYLGADVKTLEFKTEISSVFSDKAILMYHMQQFADEHNGDWVADWEDLDQEKWGVEHYGGGFEVDWYRVSYYFLFGISVKSKKIAKAMLEEFKDELEIYLK